MFIINDIFELNTGDSLCCAAVPCNECTIDVSGLPGASQTGQAAAGRNAGDNGSTGAPGGDGSPGGSITLRVPATTGVLRNGSSIVLKLKAGGGQGGYGQQGGNGAQGATGATAVSTCSRAWDNTAGRRIGSTGYCQDQEDQVRLADIVLCITRIERRLCHCMLLTS